MAEQTSRKPNVYFPPQPSNIIPGRTGCVTLYILLMIPGAVVIPLTAYSILQDVDLSLAAQEVVQAATPTTQALLTVICVAAVWVLLQVIGLWRMRHWGRYLAIAFMMVCLVSAVVTLIYDFASGPLFSGGEIGDIGELILSVLGQVVGIYIYAFSLRYFWRYAEHFKKGF